MKKQLLIDMLQIAYNNHPTKVQSNLLLALAVHPELGDYVTMESFNNEEWEVRQIRWIKQCFDFYLR